MVAAINYVIIDDEFIISSNISYHEAILYEASKVLYSIWN